MTPPTSLLVPIAFQKYLYAMHRHGLLCQSNIGRKAGGGEGGGYIPFVYKSQINIIWIANDFHCHSWLSGYSDCHELRFSTVSNVNDFTQVH